MLDVYQLPTPTLEMSSAYEENLIVRAVQLKRNGKYKESRDIYENLLKNKRYTLAIYGSLAKVLACLEMFDESIHLFELCNQCMLLVYGSFSYQYLEHIETIKNRNKITYVEFLDYMKSISGNPNYELKITINSNNDVYKSNYTEDVVKEKVNINDLFKAVESGNIQIVKNYVNEKQDVNIKNNSGDTPLMVASLRGNYEIVKLLLEAGANINETESQCNETALYMAVFKNHGETVKTLLDFNANTNIETKEGSTCLLMAVKNGNVDIVNLLINSNARINYIEKPPYITPIGLAVSKNEFQIAKLLIERGAKKNVRHIFQYNLYDVYEENLKNGKADRRFEDLLKDLNNVNYSIKEEENINSNSAEKNEGFTYIKKKDNEGIETYKVLIVVFFILMMIFLIVRKENDTEFIDTDYETNTQPIEVIESNLNSSLVDYQEEVLQFKADKYIIRIDKMSSGHYRYASFDSPKTIRDEPNTVLETGYFNENTSSFEFPFHSYTYIVEIKEGYPSVLKVLKNGKIILNKNVDTVEYSVNIPKSYNSNFLKEIISNQLMAVDDLEIVKRKESKTLAIVNNKSENPAIVIVDEDLQKINFIQRGVLSKSIDLVTGDKNKDLHWIIMSVERIEDMNVESISAINMNKLEGEIVYEGKYPFISNGSWLTHDGIFEYPDIGSYMEITGNKKQDINDDGFKDIIIYGEKIDNGQVYTQEVFIFSKDYGFSQN